MTNIEDSSHIVSNNSSNNQTLGNTSPLTELNTSPQKDPFEYNSTSSIRKLELGAASIEASPSDSKFNNTSYHSDISSSELSDINSDLETERMDLPEGSELKAMAEFMAEENTKTENNNEKDEVKDNEITKQEEEEVKEEVEADEEDDADEEAEDEELQKDKEEEEPENQENEEEKEEEQLDEEQLAKLKEEEAKQEEEKRKIELERQRVRQEAIEDLTEIEIEYAKLKDALYQSQLAKLEYELKLCLDGSHPDFIRILNKINENYDKKMKILIMSQNYRLDCINNQTKATRFQVHQQFLKNCQDLKIDLIEETTTKWYEINKERRMMDQIPISNNKKRILDSENKSILFNEIGKLNKIQKIYGFPSGISNLASAEDNEIEEDLIAMRRTFQA